MSRRLQVLFLAQRLPYAPNRGDRMRAYHELRVLRPAADVHVVALTHDDEEDSRAGDLTDLAASVATARVPRLTNHLAGAVRLPTPIPLTFSLLDSPQVRPRIAEVVRRQTPDVVLGYCSSMARFALQPPLDGLPLVIDMVDADSAKWRALADRGRGPLSWIYAREARCLRVAERQQMARAYATICVNDREAAHLREVNPSARVLVVPIGVDLEGYRRPGPAADSSTVVFTGMMDYAPNVEGALWFAREVWPEVRAGVPGARLVIVGAHPTRAVRALDAPGSGIEVTGFVPDVRPYLWRGAVSVAPLHTARGVQTKVLEAVAAGLPAVVTPAVLEGVPPEVAPACLVADDAATFARHVASLLTATPGEREARAARAALSSLRWEERLKDLPGLLVEAARTRR